MVPDVVAPTPNGMDNTVSSSVEPRVGLNAASRRVGPPVGPLGAVARWHYGDKCCFRQTFVFFRQTFANHQKSAGKCE